MKLSTQAMKKGLADAQAALQNFQAKVYQTGSALKGMLAGAAALAGAAGLKKMVTAASDVTEATNLMDTVFGAASKAVVADADKMAAAFGTSKKEYLDAAGAFGGIFKGLGYTADEAARLSVAMIHLADDMASQKNLTFAQSLEKIQGGLAGEADPLKRVGVLMDEDTVKAYAYANGIARMGTELSQAQKVQARMGVITKSLADVQGDHARTANEVAGAMKGLSGRIENLAATFGSVLEPVAKSVLGQLNTGLAALSIYWEQTGKSALDASSQQVQGASEASGAAGMLQQSVAFIADAWQGVKLAFLFVQEKVTDGLIWMVKHLEGFANGINTIVGSITGLKVATADFTRTWLEDLERMKAAQHETFEKAAIQLPASQAVNQAFAEAQRRIAAARQDFLKTPDVSGIKAPAGSAEAKAEKAKGVKFASAMLRGSSEATNTILRSRFGGGRTNDELKKQTGIQTQIRDGINKMAANLAAGTALSVVSNF